MELSVVTTLYRSAPHLREFHRRISAAASQITDDYELILVNDGSLDDVQQIAIQLCQEDSRVSVIELSRNFGHHKAMMTGLERATGKWVFLIDCDLEEDPELLEQFYKEALGSGVDVVYGVQTARKGGMFERLSGAFFYWLINLLSDRPIPKNFVTARIMKQEYVRSLVEHRDQEMFIGGLWMLTGYHQVQLPILKHHRGDTSYGLGRRISAFVNSITSHTAGPLFLIFCLGASICAISGLAGLYLIIVRIFSTSFRTEWPWLMVSVWFLGGLVLFALGVIGIYLAKVFSEVKRRPFTITRSVHGRLNRDDHGS
jgi:putative glycosyltransferase